MSDISTKVKEVAKGIGVLVGSIKVKEVARGIGGLVGVLGIPIVLGANCLAFADQVKPLCCPPKTYTSFTDHQQAAENQFGDNFGAHLYATISYPGAKIGGDIHNHLASDDNYVARNCPQHEHD